MFIFIKFAAVKYLRAAPENDYDCGYGGKGEWSSPRAVNAKFFGSTPDAPNLTRSSGLKNALNAAQEQILQSNSHLMSRFIPRNLEMRPSSPTSRCRYISPVESVTCAVNALQALAKTCSAKLRDQTAPSRPLTPQATKKTKVSKTKPSKQHRHSQIPRGPRRMATHRFF